MKSSPKKVEIACNFDFTKKYFGKKRAETGEKEKYRLIMWLKAQNNSNDIFFTFLKKSFHTSGGYDVD